MNELWVLAMTWMNLTKLLNKRSKHKTIYDNGVYSKPGKTHQS